MREIAACRARRIRRPADEEPLRAIGAPHRDGARVLEAQLERLVIDEQRAPGRAAVGREIAANPAGSAEGVLRRLGEHREHLVGLQHAQVNALAELPDEIGNGVVRRDGTVPAGREREAELAVENCPEQAISLVED